MKELLYSAKFLSLLFPAERSHLSNGVLFGRPVRVHEVASWSITVGGALKNVFTTLAVDRDLSSRSVTKISKFMLA